MRRREFLKSGALAVTGAALQRLDATTGHRQFVLENKQLAWRLEADSNGIRPKADGFYGDAPS
jgi:hypothetical protein